jgi:BirA family biotin operon repressor/biotin-[acetyl-CoA-carboxylase] ligase
VLVEGMKVAGVLVDMHWNGCQIMNVILGIGINTSTGSVPPADELDFPATSLEEARGKEISRLDLLVQLMVSLQKWYSRIAEPSFIKTWDDMLAYKGQRVELSTGQAIKASGIVEGISDDGSLLLRSDTGGLDEYYSGEISLRLVDR